jgi:hypothetical protein
MDFFSILCIAVFISIGGKNLIVWHIGGKAYVDIDDAVQMVVGLVGDDELEAYKESTANWKTMIYKQARADLKQMKANDVHDFLGVIISAVNF